MKNAVWTLPNLLTAGRIVLAPVVVGCLAEGEIEAAFGWFVLAALTDLLDGNLARWLDQKSVLGAWLDPIADKLMLLSSLFMLVWVGLLPVYLAVLVAIRDALILSGAAGYRWLTGGLEVAPTWLGKVATFIEFCLVSLVLAEAALKLGMVEWIAPLALGTAALVLLSGGHYVWLWLGKTRSFLRSRQSSGRC